MMARLALRALLALLVQSVASRAGIHSKQGMAIDIASSGEER